MLAQSGTLISPVDARLALIQNVQRAFNFATVHAHFEETIDINQLPPCNIYNFDEIGIQVCGGRKDAGEEFFFSADDKSRSYS